MEPPKRLPRLVVFVALALLASRPDARAQATEPSARGALLSEAPIERSATAYAGRHALVVGIDDYHDPAYPDLGYAVADARAIARLLVDDFGFPQDDVRLILDQDATKDALDEALEEWAADPDRVGEEDLLVVFFAGHGVTRDLGERGSRGYLVPVDGRTDRRGEPAWSSLTGMNFLEDVSEAIPAKHALFVLDCCFGGLALSRAAPPVAAGLTNRARQAITAGGADQTVLDSGGRDGHSVFTGAILDGLEGMADLDADGVITFGELYKHVGRDVERKTEQRQTPLQATFPDHEGGSVALFPPGLEPGTMTAADRLAAMERTAEERLDEVERLSDALLVDQLVAEVEQLWPMEPAMVPSYRGWLARAKQLVARRPQHEQSVRLVRQEAYLGQVVAGLLEEGEGTEPLWDEIDPKVRWRFETFSTLLERLSELDELVPRVEQRLEIASMLERVTIEARADDWDRARAAVAAHPDYGGLDLSPQLGLIPLGPDPRSGLWEFAHLVSGTPPSRDPRTGALSIADETGIVLVLLPGGTFTMGAQPDDPSGPNFDPDALDDETPHPVTLAPFFMSKYELTQRQWERLAGGNPSYYMPIDEWQGQVIEGWNPVEMVSWRECERLLFQVGLVLPTEAQWEYAARGGTTTPYWTGVERETLVGAVNLADQAAARGGFTFPAIADWPELDDGWGAHAPVDWGRPNPFGLHNVHGNVWEWCRDDYVGYDLPAREGDGLRAEPESRSRVIRGGGFDLTSLFARVANRYSATVEYRGRSAGVRPAAALRD